MKNMHRAILAFGSNLEDRYKNITAALAFVNKLPETKVVKVSKIYETEPVGTEVAQNYYLNCCAVVETGFEPEILLGCLLGIETVMGRKRPYKNSPRIIDIDLIMYENVNIFTNNLKLPHPLWNKRLFVLLPILDLYESGKVNNFDLKDLIKRSVKSGVKLYEV